MTSTVPDQDDSTHENGESAPLSRHQEREVTRLLADSRHTEPIPDEVVARLDDALASLTTDRRARDAAHGSSVVDLAARRRTRRVRLLVAAAAVVVAGVTLPSYLPQLTSGSDEMSSSDSAGSAAVEEDAPDPTASEDSGADTTADGEAYADGEATPPAADAPPSDHGLEGLLSYMDVIRIRPEHFATDVRRGTGAWSAAKGYYDLDALARDQRSARKALSEVSSRCVPDDLPGRLFSASYDGRPGVLLVGPRVEGQRRYQLFVCEDPELTRSVVLPAE